LNLFIYLRISGFLLQLNDFFRSRKYLVERVYLFIQEHQISYCN